MVRCAFPLVKIWKVRHPEIRVSPDWGIPGFSGFPQLACLINLRKGFGIEVAYIDPQMPWICIPQLPKRGDEFPNDPSYMSIEAFTNFSPLPAIVWLYGLGFD